MANSTGQQIGIVFGVKGSGINGTSGKEIRKQLKVIADEISKSGKYTQVKFSVDEKKTQTQIQKQLNQIAKGLTIKIGGFDQSTIQQNAKKQADALTRQVDNARNKLAGMGGKADVRKYAGGNILDKNGKQITAVATAYQAYTQSVKDAQKAEQLMNANRNPQTQQAFIDAVNRAKNAQQQLNAVFSNSTAFEKQETVYQKVIARITEYQAKYKETLKNTPQLAAQLEELRQKLDSNTFVGTENKANQMFVSLTNQIRQAGGEAETLGQKIRRIFGEKLGYGIIASAAMMARRAVREVYTNVVELDKAVVDLQIATGKNREEVKELVSTYSELGRELGATTSEVAQASDSWLRQGYSIEQVNELTRNSIMLAKLGQMESADATTALTSALRGYELQAEDVGSVTDKLVAVDMTAAVTAGKKIA